MYEIEERKWLPNAIVRIKDNKKKVILSVYLPKKEGDVLVDEILKYLNSKQNK